MLQNPQRALHLSPGPLTSLQNEGHTLASAFTLSAGPNVGATAGRREEVSPGGRAPAPSRPYLAPDLAVSAEAGGVLKGYPRKRRLRVRWRLLPGGPLSSEPSTRERPPAGGDTVPAHSPSPAPAANVPRELRSQCEESY